MGWQDQLQQWMGITPAVASSYNAALPAANQYDYLPDYQRGVQGAYGSLDSSQNVGSQQGAYADMLRRQVSGEGPSLAQLLLQQAQARNSAQASGAIASVRGMSPALQQRMALQQRAGFAQQTAQQAAMLRAQEQMQAQQMLGAALAQQRGQDLSQGGLQGQLAQGAGNLNQGQMNSAIDVQRINAQTAAENARIAAMIQMANSKQKSDIMNGLGEAASKLFSGSSAKSGGGGKGGGAGGGAGVASTSPGDTDPTDIAAGRETLPASDGGYGDTSVPIDNSPSWSDGLSLPAGLDGTEFGAVTGPPSSGGDSGKIGGKDDNEDLGFARGGRVPGNPRLPFNSSANDTVDARLSPGEVVVDLDHLDDSPSEIGRFVKAAAKHGAKAKKSGGLSDVRAIRAKIRELDKMLEAM